MKLLITILAALVCCSVNAQTGTADTIYILDSLLCKIGRKDQEVRAEWAKVATGNVTQEQAIEYAMKMEETDSTNLAVVSNILDTYGWPSGFVFSIGFKPNLREVFWPYITFGYSF